jgi:formylglycine-generating enzyme required for sulfatase activity
MGMLLMTALSACEPKSTPNSTGSVSSSGAPVQPAKTFVLAATATLQPIALAGPEMKVGSTYPYWDGTLLVAVPGGLFIMGRGGFDNPEHKVNVGDFWIYSTKVTNQQYEWCVNSGECSTPDLNDNQGYGNYVYANFPVVGVKWAQAADYCTFVHGRLPTEAEWEKAARGPDGNIYPWGNNAPICNLLNFRNCVGKTTKVNKYPQNASYYSAVDMEGNTFEWVADWYDAMYYKTSPIENPLGPDSGLARSVRSAGYKANIDQVQAAVRFKLNPGEHHRDLGFRCVVEDPTYFAPFCQTMVQYGKDASGGNNFDGSSDPCPPPKIVALEDCGQGSTPVNNVHLESSTSTKITSVSGGDTCKPPLNDPSDTGVHVCPLDLTITITATCDIPASGGGTGSCPSDEYELSADGTTCNAKGRPGVCPTGFTFDSVNLCCSAQSGHDLQTCSTGYHEYQGSCVSDDSNLHDVPVDPIKTQSGKVCGGDGGTDNGCELPSYCSKYVTSQPPECSCP